MSHRVDCTSMAGVLQIKDRGKNIIDRFNDRSFSELELVFQSGGWLKIWTQVNHTGRALIISMDLTHVPAHHYYPEEIWENDSLVKLAGNVMMEKKGVYSQDLFTEKALAFIDREHKAPFFLYLAYTIPHYELTIPEDQKTQYIQEDWPLREMKMGHYRNDKNGHVTYASMVSRMDRNIGKLLNKLKEKGISDNTLVIFYQR